VLGVKKYKYLPGTSESSSVAIFVTNNITGARDVKVVAIF